VNEITFVANGKPRSAPSGATVYDFLRDLDLAPPQVVVEYNGEPLERESYSLTLLRIGDRIEIAQMVGGG
jgi:thiamine biosynthesis protein ThiS